MKDLVLYDGVCGLCHGVIRFILGRDARGHFVFASLQSSLAHQVLARHGRSAEDLDTVYLVRNYASAQESVLFKGRAIIAVFRGLGGIWSSARILEVLPERLLDWGYDLIARRRYRFFGRRDVCVLPPPQVRARFVDVGDD
jgi:predicted DCC family thiol-disulfide oxidoreductase YuxK